MEVKISINPMYKNNSIFTKIDQQNSNIKRNDPNLKLKENSGILSKNETLPNITDKLITLGYSLESINLAFKRYKFMSLENAISIIGFDSETGYYHHQFYPQDALEDNDKNHKEQINKYQIEKNSPVCIICKDNKEKHFSIYSDNQLGNSSAQNDSNVNLFPKEEYILENFKRENKNSNNNVKLNSTFIEKLELEFLNKDLCNICFANEIKENAYKLQCGHIFCLECLKHYLENLILESKVENIKCLQAGCTHIISDKIIQENVAALFFDKFVKFKNRLGYMEKIKKGYIPCTAPDCEEWVLYLKDDNPFIQCNKGHKFCANCKENWHGRKSCQNV